MNKSEIILNIRNKIAHLFPCDHCRNRLRKKDKEIILLEKEVAYLKSIAIKFRQKYQ